MIGTFKKSKFFEGNHRVMIEQKYFSSVLTNLKIDKEMRWEKHCRMYKECYVIFSLEKQEKIPGHIWANRSLFCMNSNMA